MKHLVIVGMVIVSSARDCGLLYASTHIPSLNLSVITVSLGNDSSISLSVNVMLFAPSEKCAKMGHFF